MANPFSLVLGSLQLPAVTTNQQHAHMRALLLQLEASYAADLVINQLIDVVEAAEEVSPIARRTVAYTGSPFAEALRRIRVLVGDTDSPVYKQFASFFYSVGGIN